VDPLDGATGDVSQRKVGEMTEPMAAGGLSAADVGAGVRVGAGVGNGADAGAEAGLAPDADTDAGVVTGAVPAAVDGDGAGRDAWQAYRIARRHLAARRIALAWRAWRDWYLRCQAIQSINKTLLNHRARHLLRLIREELTQHPKGNDSPPTLLAPSTLPLQPEAGVGGEE